MYTYIYDPWRFLGQFFGRLEDQYLVVLFRFSSAGWGWRVLQKEKKTRGRPAASPCFWSCVNQAPTSITLSHGIMCIHVTLSTPCAADENINLVRLVRTDRSRPEDNNYVLPELLLTPRHIHLHGGRGRGRAGHRRAGQGKTKKIQPRLPSIYKTYRETRRRR